MIRDSIPVLPKLTAEKRSLSASPDRDAIRLSLVATERIDTGGKLPTWYLVLGSFSQNWDTPPLSRLLMPMLKVVALGGRVIALQACHKALHMTIRVIAAAIASTIRSALSID